MGADISLIFEKRINQRWYPLDTRDWKFDNRDYELFYLLAGQRGYENTHIHRLHHVKDCQKMCIR